MRETVRLYPFFALCGLNCGLCPRHHTDGPSACPGCGGPGFDEVHPACAVVSCNRKRDSVEFCVECSSYPCARFEAPSEKDSFITYQHVLSDFQKLKSSGLDAYRAELTEKMRILDFLLRECNDGRRKTFYCTAVNLLELPVLERLMARIGGEAVAARQEPGERVRAVVGMFEEAAREQGVELKLRK